MISFGLLAAFAVRDGYSPSHYGRLSQAKALRTLGRLVGTQGRPSLRCTEGFLTGAKKVAQAIAPIGKAFMMDHRGQLIEPSLENTGDFVRFVIQSNHIYATIVQLDGRSYWLNDSPVIGIGEF